MGVSGYLVSVYRVSGRGVGLRILDRRNQRLLMDAEDHAVNLLVASACWRLGAPDGGPRVCAGEQIGQIICAFVQIRHAIRTAGCAPAALESPDLEAC